MHRMYRFVTDVQADCKTAIFPKTVNPRGFQFVVFIMGSMHPPIERINNFPDLFMTSEILDCLSFYDGENSMKVLMACSNHPDKYHPHWGTFIERLNQFNRKERN